MADERAWKARKFVPNLYITSLTRTRPFTSPCVPFPKDRVRKESRLSSHPLWRTRLDSLSSQITKLSKKRTKSQSLIYSAEQQAIITAMESTTQTNEPTIIATDSLSSLLAASGNRWTRNSKTRSIMKLPDN
jgi:hypothetical protein